MVLRKLAVSNLLTRKIRVALTVAAIALSVSLVVAVTSGYASAVEAAHFYLNRFLGATDVLVTRQGYTSFPQTIVEELERVLLHQRRRGAIEEDVVDAIAHREPIVPEIRLVSGHERRRRGARLDGRRTRRLGR